MRTYEIMYVVRPNIEEDAKKAVVERFNGILASEGSEVLEEKDWGNAVLLTKLKISKKASTSSYALKQIITKLQTNSNV